MAKEELLLTDYLEILLRRKWLVFFCFVLCLLATDWWARQESVRYRSRARFKVQRQLSFADMTDLFITGTGDPVVNYVHEVVSYVVVSNAAARVSAPELPSVQDISGFRASVSAQRIERSDVIEVTVIGGSPEESANRCNALLTAFIEVHDGRLQQNAREVLASVTASYDKLMTTIKEREDEMVRKLGSQFLRNSNQDMLSPLRARLVELELQLQDLRLSGNYTDDYVEIVRITNQVHRLESMIASEMESEFMHRLQVTEYERFRQLMDEKASVLVRQMEEARITVDRKAEVVHILEPALPGSPIGTARTRKTVAGGLLGLMVGIILAFTIDNLDTSVRTMGEVEDIFRLPVIGAIPHFSFADASSQSYAHRTGFGRVFCKLIPVDSFAVLMHALRGSFGKNREHVTPGAAMDERLVLSYAPMAPASEAFRTLQTNLRLSLQEGHDNLLMVTSASPQEGKTTTLVNVGIAFAQSGLRTLLVEADMRRPQLYRTFGVQREGGLADVLHGDRAWQDVVKDHADLALSSEGNASLVTMPGMDKLFILTSGTRTTQPAELLSQPIMGKLLDEWRAAYDIVLLDATPIIPVPDGIILAAKVKHVVVVYQQGTTARQMTQRSIMSLQSAGATVLGIVMNDLRSYWVDPSESYRYKLYYGATK